MQRIAISAVFISKRLEKEEFFVSETVLINEIEKQLGLASKLYDFLRIIDPLSGSILEKSKECSSFFGDEPLREDSLAIKAFWDNECYVRLKQSESSTFLISAFPIKSSERQLVLELYKNVSTTLSLTCESCNDTILNLAMRDDLTKLFNRRYVDERLPKDIGRAVATQTPLSLVFLDIDNMKDINDSLGHEFGDKLLVAVSGIILHSIRAHTDWVARYGGDEFLICLNDIPEADACEIAERIRNKIAEPFVAEGKKVLTSASLGLYCVKQKEISPAELIALADKKMYEAKKSGKNRIKL